jgi:hypothetical protein
MLPPLVVRVQAQGRPSTLPAQAASIQLDGELEVQIEDATGGSRLHHFLNVGSERVRLRFPGPPPDLTTGARVRARGRLANHTLELSSSSGSMQTLALANPNTFGEQRTAVILVNFQDNTSVPYQWTTAHNVTFGEVSNYFLHNSYSQTWITGQVFGWYTLPMSNGTCDYNKISTLADQAVAAAGQSLSGFTRKIYAFPQSSACGWWGLGSVGGNPSRAWINGSYALKVVAHELGHNFGDYHSNSQPCSSSGCSTSEYGDDRDMMGLSSVGHFTSFQKERLGWLSYGSSPGVQTVSTSGAYFIEGYGTPWSGNAPKALKILKSTDAYGRRTWYYVESRAKLGYDAGFAAGVTIHTGSEVSGNSSYQIDLAPATTAFDSLLDPGQVFTDATLDLAITTVSASDTGAWVEVSYPGVACTTAAPTVTMSPAGVTTQAGQAVTLSVGVRNNDNSSGCAAVQFSLDAAAPAGWSPVYGQTVLTIAPGATATTTLTVTPPPGTIGTSSVAASAARLASSGPGGSASVSVNVVSSLGVTLSTATSGNAIAISARVLAGSNPVSGAKVTFTVKNPLGKTTTSSATTSSSGVATLKLRMKPKDPKGTYTVQATATSAGLTGTATGSFGY